jgi:Tol biopolymer transport system component
MDEDNDGINIFIVNADGSSKEKVTEKGGITRHGTLKVPE